MRRTGRDRAGRFLVEGAQAVREALRHGGVRELIVTDAAAQRHPELLLADVPVVRVTERAAATLSDTVTPQGILAVCDLLDVPLESALAGEPKLVAVCVAIADPGNAGTVIRVADAAGADAVVLAGDTVDPHNGKAVRASTGSVFHLPIARERDALPPSPRAGPQASRCSSRTGTASSTCTNPPRPRCSRSRWRGYSVARPMGSRPPLRSRPTTACACRSTAGPRA